MNFLRSRLKLNLRKYICLGILLLVSIMLMPVFAVAQGKVVRVGWTENAYTYTNKNGERSGYGYEYQMTVAGYTGWQYEYVQANTWAELLQLLQNGQIDMMGNVSYTADRAQKMLFSELPMGEERYYLYVDLRHTGISASDLSSLNGKKIGVIRDGIPRLRFHEWEDRHSLHTQYVDINSVADVKTKLANHEIDGFVSVEDPQWASEGIAAIAHVGDSNIYFVISPGRQDIKDELDKAMTKMDRDKPFYDDKLYERYLSVATIPVLHEEEKQWLQKHGAIRIGYLKDDPSVSNYDAETGKPVGVINDYVKFAEDCFSDHSLKFELVGFDSRSEQLQALKDKKIDMVFHVSQNPYAAEQNGFALSNTAWAFNLAVLTAHDNFNENVPNRIALTRENFALKWYLAYNYPNWEMLEYDTIEEVERAVVSGEADCFITGASQVLRFSDGKKLRCVFLTQPGTTSFAVDRSEVVLLGILNKTLKAMPPAMITGALAMYDNTSNKVTVMEFVKEHLLLISILLTVIVMMLVALLKRSKTAEARAKQAAEQTMTLNGQLQEAVRAAEQADAAKTSFLFSMSHDIRTPMSAILGYTKLIKEEVNEPQKVLNYQGKMEQAGNLLLSIINNVLDMARIASGKVELNECCCSSTEVLRTISDVFEIEAQKKKITFVRDFNVKPQYIMCDLTKLRQIFANLISNAIKYTLEGGTVILRSEELAGAKEGYVRIRAEIMDSGIGMSKEFLPKLFEPFAREHNTTTSKVSGTGLGMPIVKRLVTMLGGTIEVESELGKGTKYILTLEHRLAAPEDIQRSEIVATEDCKELLIGKSVLLAEDNDLNAEIAQFVLQKMGLVVTCVADGEQCVRELEKQPAGTYAAVLMDIQMPNLDGYQATQVIRNMADKAKAAIPIIAMTANAFDEDRKNAFKAGMNGHIAKPIDAEKLEALLAKLLK